MTHKVHPFSHRLGIIRDWKSRWFGPKDKYAQYLKQDVLIREFLVKRLRGSYISSIEMERSEKTLRVIIKTSRPGMVIGRSGEGSTKLREDVAKLVKRKGLNLTQELKLDIEEVRVPEADASIVAYMVAEGLEKRMPFRRVLKQTVEKVVANRDVKGVRIVMSGRLGGADMARREELKKGQIPLQTFRADIDFAREKAHLPYGDIGIQVWIYRGMIFDKDKTATHNA
ncbi:MAG: 30S ribosomal protein S3 [Candidatus Paceibacterota bacterium]